MKNMAISQAIQDITSVYKCLGNGRKNDSLCYSHNIFAARELSDISLPTYTWQWNLSNAEYNGIKTLLKKYSNELSKIIPQSTICCKLIQLYISEWYKREYNGNDSNNAFLSIGLEDYSTLPEKICKQLGIDDKKVYKSRNINGNEVGQNEWLYTIYVDGGLPLTYLLNPTKATNFKNTLYEIISEKNNEISLESVGDDLDDLCGNGVVNQSYRARELYPGERDASIYDFIQEFILTESLQIEGFENFKDIIKEAKQRANDNKKKFEIRAQVFKTSRYFIISPQLFLKAEQNSCNYTISNERLNAWGVTPNGKPFELQIKCGGKTVWKEYYEICLSGDYVTRSRKTLYDLHNISLSYLSMPWQLVYQQGNNSVLISGAVENKMAEQGYIQLYGGEFYTWSSKSSNNYNRSAILFDKDVVKVLDASKYTEEATSDDLYGWVEFDESIQLETDGKIHTKYCKAGQLIATPRNESEHPLHEYHNGLDVDGQSLKLIIVGNIPEFDVRITKNSWGEITSKSVSVNDIRWEYRKGDNGEYKPLIGQSINTAGYYQLRLTYTKILKTTVIPCFALNGTARVHSELGNNPRTDFQNFGEVRIYHAGNELRNEDGTFRKYWTNQLNYNNPIATYRIEDDASFSAFELCIPQPIDAIIACDKRTDKIIFLGKGVGKNSNEKPTRLPILFAGRVNFCKLPEKVLFTEYNPIDGWAKAFDALRNYNFLDSTLLSDNGKSYFRVQTYTHTFNYSDCFPDGLRHLKFVFVPIKSPSEMVPISFNDGGRFDVSEIGNQEGIIIPKVDYHNPPQEIIKPMYFPGVDNKQQMGEKEKRNARNRRIGEYNSMYTQSVQPAIDYFKIAVETGMYFGSFDALLGLMLTREYDAQHYEYNIIPSSQAPIFLAKLYRQYYDDCLMNGVKVHYDALWRLADEFLFDWTLVPRNIWKKEFGNNLSLVTELFNHRYSVDENDLLAIWINDCYMTYRLGTMTIPDRMNEWNIYVRTITDEYGRGRNSQDKAYFWNLNFEDRVTIMKWLRNKEGHNVVNNYIIT